VLCHQGVADGDRFGSANEPLFGGLQWQLTLSVISELAAQCSSAGKPFTVVITAYMKTA
jgi:hypothetical protein